MGCIPDDGVGTIFFCRRIIVTNDNSLAFLCLRSGSVLYKPQDFFCSYVIYTGPIYTYTKKHMFLGQARVST